MTVEFAPPTNLWKVAVGDVLRLPADKRDEMLAWVAGLGVDVMTISPTFAVTQDGDTRQYRLHLSRFVCDDEGRRIVDHAARRVHTEPLVITITDFPAWLPVITQGAH